MSVKKCCYTFLHAFGCISFPRLIFPHTVDIYNEAATESYFDSLVSYKQLFKALRHYCTAYYSTKDNPIPATIFDVIESIHGNHKKSRAEKTDTFTQNWMELTSKECKNIYIAPLLFGFVEMFLIFYIHSLVVYITFTHINTRYYTNCLFNLSLTLSTVTLFHIIGNIYQIRLSQNVALNAILLTAKYKTKCRNDTTHTYHNEKFIGIQKWYNLLIVTCQDQYQGNDIWKLCVEKYVALFFIATGIVTVCSVEKELTFDSLRTFYIMLQLIIFPAWFVTVTLGIKRCFSCKIFNCTFLIVMLSYTASLAVLCMHYYELSFLKQMRFASYLMDNNVWMRWCIAFNMGLNGTIMLYLICCMKPYRYLRPHTHLRYYVICLLLIYQTVTVKQFFHVFGYWASSPIQFILTIVLYAFIVLSNLVYFGTIHIEYYARNDINFAGYHGLKYSIFALFCFNACPVYLNTYSTPRYAKDWLLRLVWQNKRHSSQSQPARSDATIRQSRLLF